MVKVKVTQAIVNRGGKSYIAEQGTIEVSKEDIKHFEGFKKVKVKKVTPKKETNEDIKKGS